MEKSKIFLFSNKGSHRGNVKPVEDDKFLQHDSDVAEELSNFFKEAVSSLDINENSYISNSNSRSISDPTEKAISKYKFYPSILLINDKIINSFQPISKFRSSHRRCYLKKVFLKIFAKFTRKHRWQSLFFDEVAGGSCNFIKKETLSQVVSCEFCKIFKNNFLIERLRTTASPN